MKNDLMASKAACETEVESLAKYRQQLPELTESIIESCDDPDCFIHIGYYPIPLNTAAVDIINRLRDVLFPGYFAREGVDMANLRYSMGQSVSLLFDMLSKEITSCIRHDCMRYDYPCTDCIERGKKGALALLESIPALRKILSTDVRATYDGDPAAKSHDEIIFCYPGLFAITVYRMAHVLFKQNVPLLPRIMTEHAHSITGIDIHPGAEIGERFVIDHGTGIVIGETTRIGNNVRIYQGVTLGGLSIPMNGGEDLRGKKRHPTIEDDVIIYSGATILGANAVIGTRTVIGGNVWITESVPPDTTVIMEKPRLTYK